MKKWEKCAEYRCTYWEECDVMARNRKVLGRIRNTVYNEKGYKGLLRHWEECNEKEYKGMGKNAMS